MTGELRYGGASHLRRWAGLVTGAGLALLVSQSAATGADQGAQLFATCAACHRLDGAGRGIPNIIGLDEKKLSEALLAYRASESPNHIMHAVALSLTDEEIAKVARYVAEQGKQAP